MGHLRDQTHGHLLRHPTIDNRLQEAIAAIADLLNQGGRAGDVIYFEVERASKRVVTMGHHFRYRWRYRDTVHRSRIGPDRSPSALQEFPDLRAVLCPSALEQQLDDDGRPKALTGARLLFGYVGSRDTRYQADEPLTFGLGVKSGGQRGDLAQLAGRISINMATEDPEHAARAPQQRFLNADSDCLVPLRPLGSPKPSAVEHYLSQDRVGHRPDAGILCTYGDTADDKTAGDLLGRKVYLHQPGAADHSWYYELVTDKPHARPEDADMLTSDQASVGRFVSRARTRFRFRLRFLNLRPCELGALLFVLSPTRADVEALAGHLGEAGSPLRSWLAKHSNEPLLAHKLGHGRPLGLGSVSLNVDALKRLERDPGRCVREADTVAERPRLLQEFANWLQNTLGANLMIWVKGVLLPWLGVHLYAHREKLGYPRHPETGTIYEHHTDLRASHCGGRKRRAQPSRERHGLQELD
jgi:CRISPR-associated protein (TIGR03986 family)